MAIGLSGLPSCARIAVLGLSNRLVDQQYPHCDKDVAETALIGDCGHIYAHGSGSDSSSREGGTSYVMMDELETYIHARWAQVSVPVAVRVKTGTILGFDLARLSSNMKKGQAMAGINPPGTWQCHDC